MNRNDDYESYVIVLQNKIRDFILIDYFKNVFNSYYKGKFAWTIKQRIKNILIDFLLILLKLKFIKTKL